MIFDSAHKKKLSKEILLSLLLICFSGVTYSQDNLPEKDNAESAAFPGGIEGLYKYISEHLVYPVSARYTGIEGRLYVKFIVNKSGLIDSASVKTIVSLFPDCDREAERVLKSCKIKWHPGRKDGNPVAQEFTLPIVFELSDKVNSTRLDVPIPAVVGTKPAQKGLTQNAAWQVYRDADMSQPSGKLNPGDTVLVHGWAPWLYAVKSKSVEGFISWKALVIGPELKAMAKTVEKESREIELARRYKDSLRSVLWKSLITLAPLPSATEIRVKQREDSLEFLNKPLVALRLYSNKNEVYAGECATVNVSLFVSEFNKTRIQFYDLQNQVSRWLGNELNKDCWVSSGKVRDVVHVERGIDDVKYWEYVINRAAYCPTEAKTIEFSPLSLGIAKVKQGRDFNQDGPDAIDSVLNFFSKPLSIAVRPLPPETAVTGSELHKLVGKFIVNDKIVEEKVFTATPATYKLTIEGIGFTFPLPAPSLKYENITSRLTGIEDNDTIINDVYFSRKTFTYSLTFQKEGTYDLVNHPIFSAFDPFTKQVTKYLSHAKVEVAPGFDYTKMDSPPNYKTSDFWIALDVSQSMMIEDYLPYRLQVAKNGIMNFLTSRKKCDIGMMIFGGNAIQYDVSGKNTCYRQDRVQAIDFKKVKTGTAIGDAIWSGANALTSSSIPKKIVIIGDGDNTAGYVSPKMAIRIARKFGVKVFAIGIGKSGAVPFGKDYSGKPYMVSNTFSDKDFKNISLQTGGKYYWARDAAAITRILKEIFLE